MVLYGMYRFSPLFHYLIEMRKGDVLIKGFIPWIPHMLEKGWIRICNPFRDAEEKI